jgi:hypothetical protein
LDEAALATWVKPHPVPILTARRLLIGSVVSWWSDPSRVVSLVQSGTPDDELVDSIFYQAEDLADKTSLFKGISRRQRIDVIATAMKMQVGLANQEDLLRALDILFTGDPDYREILNEQLLQWAGQKSNKNPFDVSTVKRTITSASDEKLLAARDAYAASSQASAVILLILIGLIAIGHESHADLPGASALMLVWGMLILKPVHFITATLLDLWSH